MTTALEDLAVFNARLASAYAALELAKSRAETAGDAVEAVGRIAPDSVSVFADIIDETRSAALMLASAIAALPPLEDESDG